jgi:hypothetical protein
MAIAFGHADDSSIIFDTNVDGPRVRSGKRGNFLGEIVGLPWQRGFELDVLCFARRSNP